MSIIKICTIYSTVQYSTVQYSMWFDSNFILFFLAVCLEKGANNLEGKVDQHMVPPGTGASWCSSVQGGPAGK